MKGAGRSEVGRADEAASVPGIRAADDVKTGIGAADEGTKAIERFGTRRADEAALVTGARSENRVGVKEVDE